MSSHHPVAAMVEGVVELEPDGVGSPEPPEQLERLSNRRLIVRYAARRSLLFPALIFFVVTATFALVNLVPSDPARVIGGINANARQLATISKALGINGSVLSRYGHYLNLLVHGNLGVSYYTHEPVLNGITSRLMSTAEIVVLSLILGAVLGIGFGCCAAYYERRWPESAIRGAISAVQGLPDFLLGVVLIYLFTYVWHIAPGPVGQLSFTATAPPQVTGSALVDSLIAGQWSTAADAIAHLVLPVVTLGVVVSAFIAKVVRGVLSEALASEFTEFSRACGRTEWLTLRYALATIRAPMVTSLGIVFVVLFGGDAIVETLFSWNGLGQWAISSLINLDVPVIEGYVLFIALITLSSFLVVDLLVVSLDPRVLHLVHGVIR